MYFKPAHGFLYLAQGFKLIWHPDVRHFVLIPLLLNVVVFALLLIAGMHELRAGLDWLNASIPAWLHWIDWLIGPVFFLGILMAGFYCSLLIANLLAAPFNGLLAEAVHRTLQTASMPPAESGIMGFFKQAGPALMNEIRKIGYYLLRVIPLLILFLIPGLNLLAPFIWFAFTAWLLALEYIEFPLAIHSVEFGEIKRIAQHNRMLVFGFGAALELLMMIPVLNFLIMPAAVAGATLMTLKNNLAESHISHK